MKENGILRETREARYDCCVSVGGSGHSRQRSANKVLWVRLRRLGLRAVRRL